MSLTSHLKERSSPVRQFFETHFPDAAAARRACSTFWPDASGGSGEQDRGVDRGGTGKSWNAGPPLVEPVERDGYPWATVGTAFDYEARFLLERQDVRRLVASEGAWALASFFGTESVPRAFGELEARVQALDREDPAWARPSAPEGWRAVADIAFVLALYEQCFRGLITPSWPLAQLGPDASLSNVLGLVPDDAREDLVALGRLFLTSHPTVWGAKPLVCNPTLELSGYLGGADADLIVGHRLVDIKTRAAGGIERVDLWQLLGYVLADRSDQYGITEVGMYFSRQGVLGTWPVEDLMRSMSASSDPMTLAEARERFGRLAEGLASG